MAAGANMDWRVGLVDATGVAFGTAGNPVQVGIQATAGSPASVELSDGAAFYTAAKTGQLPAALVNSRLDVNMGSAPATISTANSSTATLLANAVFTGTGEDVSSYAVIRVLVFADQASASATTGLAFQWSEDNTNWDMVETYPVFASLTAAFALRPKAKFFRVVYTNGGTNQAAFRLQTIFRFYPDFGGNSAVLTDADPNPMAPTFGAAQMIYNATANTYLRQRRFLDVLDGNGGGTYPPVGLMGQNAATLFDRIRTTPGATGTTGTGLLGAGPCLWDLVGTTNYVRQAGDGSGRAMVVGAAAAGAAIAGNPVRVGISDGTNTQDWKQYVFGNVGQAVTGIPPMGLMAANLAGSNAIPVSGSTYSDTLAANGVGLFVCGVGFVWNNSNYERLRGNTTTVVQASTLTTVQTINTDIVNYNGRAFMAHANVTNYNGGSILMKLQIKDANGLFMDIPGATTGTVTSGADLHLNVGPTVWPANTATMFNVNFFLPRNIRLVTVIATASVTFSQSYDLPAN